MDQTTRMLLTNHCRSPDNTRLAHREQLSRESFCRFYTPWKCPYVAPSSAALSMTPPPRCGGRACLEAWEFQRGVELGMAVRNVQAQVQSERRWRRGMGIYSDRRYRIHDAFQGSRLLSHDLSFFWTLKFVWCKLIRVWLRVWFIMPCFRFFLRISYLSVIDDLLSWKKVCRRVGILLLGWQKKYNEVAKDISDTLCHHHWHKQ